MEDYLREVLRNLKPEEQRLPKCCESDDLTYEITNLDRLNDEIVDCTESNNEVINDNDVQDTSLENLDFIENRSSPDSGNFSAGTITADFDSNCAIGPDYLFLNLSPRIVNTREPNIEDLQNENNNHQLCYNDYYEAAKVESDAQKEDWDLVETNQVILTGVESRFIAHPVRSAVSSLPAGPDYGPGWIQHTNLPLRDEVGEVIFLVSQEGEKVSIPATVLVAVSKTLQRIVTEDTFLNLPFFAISLPFDKDTLFAFREIVLIGKASNVRKCKKRELEEIFQMLGMSPTQFETIFPTATVCNAMSVQNLSPPKPVAVCFERIEEEGSSRPDKMFSGGRQRRGRKVKKSPSLARAPAKLRYSTQKTGRKTVDTLRSVIRNSLG